MSERGRLQDVVHDELDRQRVSGADADGIIDAILNVRDFFPLLLGGRAVQDDALDVERLARALEDVFLLNVDPTGLTPEWWQQRAREVLRAAPPLHQPPEASDG